MNNSIRTLFILSALLLAIASAGAATRTWDGEGGDGDFATPANWDGNATVPAGGDALQLGLNLGASPIFAFNTEDGDFDAPSFTFLATANAAYTVTAASFSDTLNLTGTGVTLQNLSPVRQTFDLLRISLAGSQTWSGGTRGLQIAQVDLGASHSLILDGSGATAATRNEAFGGFTGTGTSGVVKQGAGTLLLRTSAPSDYTGPTTVSGGILLLGANDQVPDSSKLTLDGGILQAAGFDDAMGILSLTKSSTLDFGLGADLAFAASAAEDWSSFNLVITNYTPGQNTWRIGTSSAGVSATQLSHILFNGTTPAQIDTAGFILPVPEPSMAMLIGGACAIVGGFVRRWGVHGASSR